MKRFFSNMRLRFEVEMRFHILPKLR